MSKRAKKRVLDILGLLISFAFPAAAAISEFPRMTAATGGARTFAAILNISTVALAIVLIIGTVTAYRFVRERIKTPKSGLAISVVLYAIVHGINVIVDSMEVILFWSVIGCGIAWVLYTVADKRYGGDTDGEV